MPSHLGQRTGLNWSCWYRCEVFIFALNRFAIKLNTTKLQAIFFKAHCAFLDIALRAGDDEVSITISAALRERLLMVEAKRLAPNRFTAVPAATVTTAP